jgi:hypothetical protein
MKDRIQLKEALINGALRAYLKTNYSNKKQPFLCTFLMYFIGKQEF